MKEAWRVHRGTARALGITLAIATFALASCATVVGPSVPAASADASATPSASNPGSEPEASATPVPWDHAAEGLALTWFPSPDSTVSHVVVVDPDGTLRQVTGVSRSSPGTSEPAWSPDRAQIAFGPPKTGSGMSFQVGVVNADGSGERVLGEGIRPQWSPDGSRILFQEVDDVTSEPLSMYVVDVASGQVTDIGQGFNPRWLPDGERISFQRMVAGRVPGDSLAFIDVLYVASADGAEPQELAVESEAAWSPDGAALLLVHDGVISLAEPDGSGARELVDGYDPAWSPDSSRIVFTSGVDANGRPLLAVVDLAGREVWSRVTGAAPAWSPDGTRLAVEVAGPTPIVRILDAASGDELWEIEGTDPAW